MKTKSYHMDWVDGKYKRIPASEINRFWSKIVYNNGCWDFMSNQDKNGYGHFKSWVNGAWKQRSAHRIMFEKLHGEIPVRKFILHKCDRPSCVNPPHLFLGTAKDNTQDMISKGRKVVLRGEDAGHAKLTNQNVIEIKARLASGEKVKTIAESFPMVSYKNIEQIKYGVSWKHL